MRCTADVEWTEKLQPAVLAANTQVKRSTGHTPFYLMFGRDSDSSNLLNLITSTSKSSPTPEDNIEDASDLEIPHIATEAVDPFEVPNDDNEWMKVIDETRMIDRNFAIASIKEEQKTQKRIFDRKVKRNRLVI